MAKTRTETVLSDDGTLKTAQFDVTQPDGTKSVAVYAVPSTETAFQKMVANLSADPKDGEDNESPLSLAYRRYVTAVIQAARASVYDAVASESTKITAGKGEKVDLMDLPLAKVVNAYNKMVDRADAIQELSEDADVERGMRPWRAAARKLCETGKARMDGNLLVAVA